MFTPPRGENLSGTETVCGATTAAFAGAVVFVDAGTIVNFIIEERIDEF